MHEEKTQLDEITALLEARDSILNNLDIAICVSDLATNEILYANAPLRQMFGDEQLTGRICWEALNGGSERCEFCAIPYLLKHPGQAYEWEIRTEDGCFQICDSIIPWANGRVAHMQCMMEIEA